MVSEHAEQAALVKWFRIQYPAFARLLFSVPNGAMLYGDRMQRARHWKRLEAEGALAGAPDLFLSIARGDLHGLYIEMKTRTGRQSEKQAAFEQAALAQGYGYAMPRSMEEGMKVIQSYLKAGSY